MKLSLTLTAILIMTLPTLAQKSTSYELSGTLNPDPQRTNRSVIDVSITIADGGSGPYKSVMTGDTSLATHTIFRPADLSVFGGSKRLPVIAYGNGACKNTPEQVMEMLSEIASHGFLILAIGPVRNAVFGLPAGSVSTDAKLLLDAVDWAFAQNNKQESLYFGLLDTEKIGVMGQSCGGLQALTVSVDPRIKTTVCLNSGVFTRQANQSANTAPVAQQTGTASRSTSMSFQKSDLARLHGPVIYLLGGQYDGATPNGIDDFNRIENLPDFLAEYDFTEQVNKTGNKGIGHYPATYHEPHGGDFGVAALSWFKWQLKGDQDAAKMFKGKPCGLENNPKWKVMKKNID